LKEFRYVYISGRNKIGNKWSKPFDYLTEIPTFAANKNNQTMKKFLTVLVIAAALTSCGSGSSDAAAKTDSAVSTVVDSAKKVMDSTATKVDSTVKAVADTAKAKIGAVADSAKKAVK
jgi:hypothetical protein